jgi:tetratricopeptide (TPR) repeat protein
MINAGLALQPDSAPLYLTRGVLNVQLAQYDKAEADFDKSEQLNPHQSASSAAYSLMAEEKNQKDPNQVLAIVRSRLAKRPDDPYLLYLQSTILAERAPDPGSAEFREAVRSAKKAVAERPSLCAAYDVLAKLYQSSDQIELSTRESRLALRCDPQDQTALYHLIQTLRKSNDKSEIPDLLKRLAKARQDATREEAEHNRFKLVAEPASPAR